MLWRSLAVALALLPVIIGVLVLVGWYLDMPHLTSIQPGWVSMKANTAFCLILSGLGILFHVSNSGADRVLGRMITATGVVVGLIGLFTSIEYISGLNLLIDEVLVKQPLGAFDKGFAGRMSPISALVFILVGVSLVGLETKSKGLRSAGKYCATGVGALGLICLSGHALDISFLYGAGQTTAVALHTAIAFVFISLGVLLSAPDMAAVFRSSRTQFVFCAVGISILLGASAYTTYNHSQRTVQLRRWVLHTQEVIISIDRLESTVKNAQVDNQTYLLTGNVRHKQRFEASAASSFDRIEGLSHLVDDNAKQRQRLDGLKAMLKQTYTELRNTSAEHAKLVPESVVNELLRQGPGDDRTPVNEAIQALKDEEENLLRKRSENLDRATNEIQSRFGFLALMGIVAISVAVAVIYQSMLSQEKERRAQNVMYSLSKILGEALSLDQAMPLCLRSFCEQFEFTVGAFWCVKEGEDRLSPYSLYARESMPEFEKGTRSMQFAKGEGLPGRVWASGAPSWVADVQRDGRFPGAHISSYDNLNSALAFPVTIGEHFYGVFEFFARSIKKPDQRTLDSFQVLATEIAQLVDRKMAAESLERRAMLDAMAAQSGDILSRNQDLICTLEQSCRCVLAHLAEVKRADIWLIENESKDSDRRVLKLLASCGIADSDIERRKNIFLPVEEVIVTAADGKQELLDNNILLHNQHLLNQDFVDSRFISDFHAFALEFGDRIIGLLTVMADEKPSKEVLSTLDGFSQNLSIAITRKKTELLLLQSERKFRAIFDQTFEFIGLLKPDGTVIEANNTILEFAGMKREDVIGTPLWETPWWSYDVNMQEKLKLAIAEARIGNFVRFESEHPDKNGQMMAVDFSLKPVLDDDGQVVLLIPEGRDISEKKEAEKRVSEFYSTVSHELRTPLTSIRGALGLLEGGKAGELSKRALQLVHMGRMESERLVRLINEILDIRKIEAGKLELKLEKLDAGSLVERTAESLQSFAEEAKVKIETRVSENVEVLGDKDRLIQVLTNLVSNAVKFSPEDSVVTVFTEVKNGNVRVNVQDHGPGISKENLRKLFQMFQQVDSSDTRPKGGTGLGLAISKAIVEQHLGKVGVDTEVGKGSTFWFELPCHGINSGNDTNSEGRGEVDLKAPKYKVLLVEDNHNLQEVMKASLADEGFEVVAASTIAGAEELLNEHFNALILDVHLPDGNGLALLDKLRVKADMQSVPVIIVSGDNVEENRFSDPFLIDWLVKPFDAVRLQRAAQVAVSRSRAGRSGDGASILIVEDDDSTREVIKQQLASLPVKILEATDGSQAIEAVRQGSPDLIILDLGLPAADGFDVVTVLRHEKAKDTPLLVYTARDLDRSEKESLKLGISAHLTKGRTNEQEFMNTVRQLLNGLIAGSKQEKENV